MSDMIWVPGMEVEEDEELMYGNHMPDNMPMNPAMFVCPECGGLNRHLRSCSKYVNDDQCEYCRAPSGFPHHVDCPEE